MNEKLMAADPQPNQLAAFFMTLLPWATLYGLVHTAIYYVFRYWSERSDARIRKIVQEENESLKESIDGLRSDFWEWKAHK